MLILTLLLVVSMSVPSQSTSATQEPTQSWLHPADAAYRRAIHDGFSGEAKIGPYNEGKDGIHQAWFNFTTSHSKNNAIIFFSPLRCAQLLGLDARQRLMDSPTVDSVHKTCDGNLFVTINYSARREADSFPLVLEHEGVSVRPPSVGFTGSPSIKTHWNGFSYDYIYTYGATFYFNPAQPWTKNVSLRYVVPEDGNPLSEKIDLSVFAKDEELYEHASGEDKR
jgi:hypothetical protein